MYVQCTSIEGVLSIVAYCLILGFATEYRRALVAWQSAKVMREKGYEGAQAVLLKTSRSQVDQTLDPKLNIAVGSLQRTAALVG